MFPGNLGYSIAGKALNEGRWTLDVHDIRASATDKHRTVDDTPSGGSSETSCDVKAQVMRWPSGVSTT